MGRHSQAFTLIELLVVVAIIGILAAVGVVAYNGYTYSAKVSQSKARHSIVSKYIASELMKCNFQNKIFDNTFNCSDRFNPSSSSNSISHKLSYLWGTNNPPVKFPHPKGTYSAATGRTPGYYNRVNCNTMWEFNTLYENTATEVKVYTCLNDKSADKIITIIPIE